MATMQTEFYYCHRCAREVHVNQDGTCSTCNEGFIEKVDNSDHEDNQLIHIVQQPFIHGMSDNPPFSDSRQTITNIIQTLFGSIDGLHSMELSSDRSDYVFTDESFDNIVTRIMNQFEQSGPPPATIQDLEKLKSRTIDKEQGSCTICLNDYVAGEELNELPCQHEYHSKCIRKWLTAHGTCPICRKDLSGKDTRLNEKEQTSTSD